MGVKCFAFIACKKLLSNVISAPNYTVTNEALEFPSAGGVGQPVMEDVPLDSAPEKTLVENEPRTDSGNFHFHFISQ